MPPEQILRQAADDGDHVAAEQWAEMLGPNATELITEAIW